MFLVIFISNDICFSPRATFSPLLSFLFEILPSINAIMPPHTNRTMYKGGSLSDPPRNTEKQPMT